VDVAGAEGQRGPDVQLRQVDPKTLCLTLRRLRQVPESRVRDKLESLRSKGQVSPLAVSEHEGQLVLVDGFARQAAAVRLGMTTVTVEVVSLTAVQMKAQLYLRNRERGLALIEECRLVRELCESDGLSQVEVAEVLERHKSWVSRRLSLWKGLSPRLLSDGALDELEAGSVRRLSLLPACNQEQLVAVSRRDGLGPRDTTTLVELWRKAPDQEARQYLLQHPQQAIDLARASSRATADPRLGQKASELYQSLVVMRQAALRAIRRARGGIEELPAEGAALLRGAVQMAERDCPWAAREVRRLMPTGKEGE
jgi:ParB/RepB/Spo0J family partition protein